MIDPAGLAHAVYRALLTAMTPPIGPVRLAIYEDAIGMQPIDPDVENLTNMEGLSAAVVAKPQFDGYQQPVAH